MSVLSAKKIHLRNIIFFVGVFVCVLFALPEKSFAQVVPVQVVGGTIRVDGGSGTQPEQNILRLLQDIHEKEFKHDPEVYKKAQEDIKKLAQETIDTLNNGDDGEPLWIRDYRKYLEEAEKAGVGKYIYEELEEIAPMCGNEKQKIQEKLTELQQEEYAEPADKVTCTLNEHVNDVEAFRQGGFSEGGWGGFMAMISDPEKNTPVGQYLVHVIGAEEAKQEAREIALLEEVDGYKPTKKTGVDNNGNETEEIVVPAVNNLEGSKIVQGLPYVDRPDELGEDQEEVWTDLLSQMLSDVNGLFGMSTYFEEVSEEVPDTLAGGVLNDAIDNTYILFEYQLEIASQIDGVEQLFDEASTTFSGDSCWDLEFPEELTEEREIVLTQIPLTITTILALEALLAEYTEAKENGSSVQVIVRDYNDLVDAGLVATEEILQEIEILLFGEIEPAVEDLTIEIENTEANCS